MNGSFLRQYLSVFLRHKMLFLSVFGVVSICALIFALTWSKYKSHATVEVVQPEIAVDAVESQEFKLTSAEALADLHISRLKQRVLSGGSLAEIITRLNLYPDQRQDTPIAYITDDMRDKINIHLLSSSLANPASAQKATALQLSAIAFTISFEYDDPELARKTVSALVSRFLDEDLKERRKKVKKTSEFLAGQIEMLSESLREQEKKIAEFRSEKRGGRPQELAFDQQAFVTTTTRLMNIESQLNANLGQIGALRAQLAQTEPYSRIVDETGEVLTTPGIQLRALKSKYATLTAKYGKSHPDVVKLKRQITALEKELGTPADMTSQLKARIEDAKTRLESSMEAYGPQHPDVVQLRNQVSSLEKQLVEAKNNTMSTSDLIVEDADNPAYLQIVAQLEAAQQQRSALQEQRDALKERQQKYQQAIRSNPAVEQEMAALTRDYDNMRTLYRELKGRKLAVDMSSTIEEGHAGQKLNVIDPPQLPRHTNPSRKLIFFGGVLFAMIAGCGSVLARQLLTQSIMGPSHLQSLTGVAPLITIPHLYTLEGKIRRRRTMQRVIGLAAALLLVMAALFFAFIMPFDVFSAIIGRKTGLS